MFLNDINHHIYLIKNIEMKPKLKQDAPNEKSKYQLGFNFQKKKSFMKKNNQAHQKVQ